MSHSLVIEDCSQEEWISCRKSRHEAPHSSVDPSLNEKAPASSSVLVAVATETPNILSGAATIPAATPIVPTLPNAPSAPSVPSNPAIAVTSLGPRFHPTSFGPSPMLAEVPPSTLIDTATPPAPTPTKIPSSVPPPLPITPSVAPNRVPPSVPNPIIAAPSSAPNIASSVPDVLHGSPPFPIVTPSVAPTIHSSVAPSVIPSRAPLSVSNPTIAAPSSVPNIASSVPDVLHGPPPTIHPNADVVAPAPSPLAKNPTSSQPSARKSTRIPTAPPKGRKIDTPLKTFFSLLVNCRLGICEVEWVSVNVVRLSFPHSAFREILKAYYPKRKLVDAKDFHQIFGVLLKNRQLHSFLLNISHIRGSFPGAMLVTKDILKKLRGLGQHIVSISKGNSPCTIVNLCNMEIHCETVDPFTGIFSTQDRSSKRITEGILNQYHTGKGGFRGRKYQLMVISEPRQPRNEPPKRARKREIPPVPPKIIDVPTRALTKTLIEKTIDQMFEEAILEQRNKEVSRDSQPKVSQEPREPQEPQEPQELQELQELQESQESQEFQEDFEPLESQEPEPVKLDRYRLFFSSFSILISSLTIYLGSWSGLQDSLSGDNLKEFQQFESTYQELQSLLGELKEKQKEVQETTSLQLPPKKTKEKRGGRPKKQRKPPKKRKQRPVDNEAMEVKEPPVKEPPTKKPQRIRRTSSFVCRLE